MHLSRSRVRFPALKLRGQSQRDTRRHSCKSDGADDAVLRNNGVSLTGSGANSLPTRRNVIWLGNKQSVCQDSEVFPFRFMARDFHITG